MPPFEVFEIDGNFYVPIDHSLIQYGPDHCNIESVCAIMSENSIKFSLALIVHVTSEIYFDDVLVMVFNKEDAALVSFFEMPDHVNYTTAIGYFRNWGDDLSNEIIKITDHFSDGFKKMDTRKIVGELKKCKNKS